MHGEVFKGGSGNSATFKMEFFAIIGNSRNLQRASSDGLTTNRQHLHVAVVTRPSSQSKLNTHENGHALKVALDTLPCFVDVFFTFFENTVYFLFHYHSVSIQKLITKMKTGITVDFIFGGSAISPYEVPEATIKMWSKKCY